MMKEIWKTIEGLEKYEVSTLGRVRNKSTGKEVMGSVQNGGYMRFDLCVNGKRIVKSGHSLVANTFIEKVEGKNIINHKDGNKTNNRVENLEWCTPKENSLHCYRVLGKQVKNKVAVMCVETGKVYESSLAAERETGIRGSLITRCCKGQRKTTHKTHWCYANSPHKH